MTTMIGARPTLLVVDDTPANLALLANLLKDKYRVIVANNGAKALELAWASVPDLVLLDVMMPEMDGYEVCRRLKAHGATERVPVIFLTAKTEVDDERMGFEVGAADFIHKPISPPIVAARVKTHLAVKAWQDFLQNQNDWLQQQVTRRLSEITHLLDASIYVMVSLAEFRDDTTGNHIRRTAEYVRVLAQQLARSPRYSAVLDGETIEKMARSAPLHDIGKIAIPDHILLKPGKLTPEEFGIMKSHAQRGCDMLQRAGEQMGEHGEYLALAIEISLCHHEKWDGSGYPGGRKGTDIPLPARLMAVADVYDALISRRVYKDGMQHEKATAIIMEGRGSHFDPDVVDTFLALQDEFRAIAARYADSQEIVDR